MTHIELLKKHKACNDAVEWAANYDTIADAWDACHRAGWMLWLHENGIITISERDLRLFACDCVRYTSLGDGRTVWDMLTDERSRNAVEVAERYAVGEATEDELDAARDAAWYAASAVWAAARAAAEAACAAVGAAARDAARDSGEAVARAAARDSGEAAARDAAWYEARAFQADLLRKRVGNPFKDQESNP